MADENWLDTVKIRLIKEEKFADNDLSETAEIYISETENAELDSCRKVYPT